MWRRMVGSGRYLKGMGATTFQDIFYDIFLGMGATTFSWSNEALSLSVKSESSFWRSRA